MARRRFFCPLPGFLDFHLTLNWNTKQSELRIISKLQPPAGSVARRMMMMMMMKRSAPGFQEKKKKKIPRRWSGQFARVALTPVSTD